MEIYLELISNDELIVFDISIILWWVWIKRFYFFEVEFFNGLFVFVIYMIYVLVFDFYSLSNWKFFGGCLVGRVVMVGFFMVYFVDSLIGLGVVD